MSETGSVDGMITVEQVTEALGSVNDPELHEDLVSLGMIRNVTVDGGAVGVTVVLTTPGCPLKAQIESEVKDAIESLSPGDLTVDVNMTAEVIKNPRRQAGDQSGSVTLQDLLPQVKNVVAVASGKGGVGKSTVATNLAIALAQHGASTGLLDADIYGPSIPTMMGLHDEPDVTGTSEEDQIIIPLERYGVKMISIGFLLDETQAVIWRGPMVMKMLVQFMSGVGWGDLDYLVIDLPPGTGDVQLTITQSVPLAGGVIVTTPQLVALADVRRAVTMFRKVGVPILGVIENMSHFLCPHCDGRTDVFPTAEAAMRQSRKALSFWGRYRSIRRLS